MNSIIECGSTLYVGLIGTFQAIIQKSTGMDTHFFLFFFKSDSHEKKGVPEVSVSEESLLQDEVYSSEVQA